MRLSRRTIGAGHAASIERNADALELDRLLDSTQGQRLLEACGGDVEHARRVISVVGHVPPLAARTRIEAPPPAAEVIRLPRPYDRELELDDDEPAPFSATAAWLVASALGLACWLLLAALAFGLYSLVEALR